MCAMALPIMGALLSIGQASAGYSAAVQQANAQNAMWQSNFNASIKAQDDRYASINNNTQQERLSASEDKMTKQIEALKKEATARVAAGESGVTGLSTTALLNDYLARQGREADAIDTNYQIKREHNADERIATNHNTIARINSVQRAAPVSKAPFIFQALGGVMGALAKAPTFSSTSNYEAG